MRVDRYWSGFFGLQVGEYLLPGIRVVPHAGLGDYRGVWLFRRGETGIVSAPADCVSEWAERVKGIAVEALHTVETLTRLRQGLVERVIGPGWQGYVEKQGFRSRSIDEKEHDALEVRALGDEDRGQLSLLAVSGDVQGWEDSGLAGNEGFAFGCFVAGELVAAARYVDRADYAAFPGIFTRPDCRGKGYGGIVLGVAFQHAIDRGKLIVYQTLMANVAARQVALRLGCLDYATHIALRLR